MNPADLMPLAASYLDELFDSRRQEGCGYLLAVFKFAAPDAPKDERTVIEVISNGLSTHETPDFCEDMAGRFRSLLAETKGNA